jgi:AmmeMemoRadiSam system protein B
MSSIREAAVAGQFYPASHEELHRQVEEFLAANGKKKIRALGVIAPHAGYMYSGAEQ